ncbi:MAG TPA: DUF1670 domain-containing protein [Anaerolineae bacterium]|nr:DUF1670 domain-containing protein [Anaerolineae bacterium]
MSPNPYYTATQRTFRQAIIHLLENEYKLVGSHRVIQMIADDIADLHAEYYRDATLVPPGHVVWRGTLDEGHKPPAGRRAEDEPTVTAVLSLITAEDIAELAQGCPKGKHARTWAHERDVRRVVRLVKAGIASSTGRLLLSLADLSLLINRSIGTVQRCILDHFEQTGELLPIKGYVLDQGSSPTHKGVILRLYEQGVAPPDVARITDHSLEAVDRYIKDYERVKVLLGKGLSVTEISHAIGRGPRTVLQYHEIALEFHPNLAPVDQEGI